MSSGNASWVDQLKGFIGELARPFAIVVTSASAAWAIVVVANKVDGGESGAIYIAAVLAGISALYWGKSWEVSRVGKYDAQARAADAPAPAQPDAASDGELPPNERIQP